MSRPSAPTRSAAVVFDFDGVLVDSEAAHGRALIAAGETIGLIVPSEQPDWYIGLGDLECFRRMARASGRVLTSEEVATLVARKGEAFAELCAQGQIDPFPGALDLLHNAAGMMPVAVCTGSRLDDVAPVLRACGVLDRLAALITADDVTKAKPDPEPYIVTAARLEIEPGLCSAIEDSPSGVAAACAAGYRRVVAVGHTFPLDRLAGAHLYCEHIAHATLEDLVM